MRKILVLGIIFFNIIGFSSFLAEGGSVYCLKIENIKKQGKIPQFNDLDITGIDLINLKFSNREIGEVKNKLYELVLGDEIENEKEALLKYIVKHYNLNDKFEYENSCGAIVFNENTA